MIPISLLRLLPSAGYAVAAICGATFSGAYYEHRIGSIERAHDRQRIEQAESNERAIAQIRAAERANQTKIQEALENAYQREQAYRLAADSAGQSADLLRQQLTVARAHLPAATAEACRVYAERLTDVFGACVSEYRAVAEEADSRGSAIITLTESWPAEQR